MTIFSTTRTGSYQPGVNTDTGNAHVWRWQGAELLSRCGIVFDCEQNPADRVEFIDSEDPVNRYLEWCATCLQEHMYGENHE